MKMRKIQFSTFLAVALLVAGSTGEARIYQYTDNNGVTRYTNDLSSVPESCRNTAEATREIPVRPARAEDDAKATKPGVGEKPDESQTFQDMEERRLKLEAKKQALDEKYQDLMRQQKKLKDAGKQLEDKKQVRAHEKKVQALNEKIRAYEEEKNALKAEIEQYNQEMDNLRDGG
jgi:chromosome segregation ATPase